MKIAVAIWNSVAALAVMTVAVVSVSFLTPGEYLAEVRKPIALAENIPKSFADWRVDLQAPALVNPELDDALSRIYTQSISRTYINSTGERVMLAVSYGPDQRADRAVHYPEVCYPAQGFKVLSNRVGYFEVGKEYIRVRRLETNYNNVRREAVTYWTTIGDFSSVGGFRKRLVELHYGLSGTIPDGLIFRVSSIGAESQREFELQERFLTDLMSFVKPADRVALMGKSPDLSITSHVLN